MTALVSVSVDVTAARRGSREAVSVSWVSPGLLNPAEANAFAGDLEAAGDIVTQLCPPPTLTPGQILTFGDPL